MNEKRKRLFALRDEKYAVFHASLCPGTENILGVRMPALRQLARELAKGDWRSFLDAPAGDTYEEILLQGLVLAYANPDFPELRARMAAFVPCIQNWAVCDAFCSSVRVPPELAEPMWNFLQPYLASKAEFPLRFAIVMGRCHFITALHFPRLLEKLSVFHSERYYARMAAAWCLADCYIKYKAETEAFLQGCRLDDFTYRKALQKICESRRVSPEDKARIRAMGRTP